VIREPRKRRPPVISAETYDSEETSDEEEGELKDTREFRKVKHTFEIQVKELKNIPILDKLIKDI
jgi:hypothetical protein